MKPFSEKILLAAMSGKNVKIKKKKNKKDIRMTKFTFLYKIMNNHCTTWRGPAYQVSLLQNEIPALDL